jgi:predicted 3-demethylubiquinone-9 3-methyltransferase (glyoxalase superfamily)
MVDPQKITPCLWFDSEAEEAARFYVSVLRNARIGKITRYGKEGFEVHGRPAGSVMTVEFEIEGESFTALNGGPPFKFTEAISFIVRRDTQEELDQLWQKSVRGRPDPAVRLAEGQVRALAADRSRRPDGADQ